MDSNPIVQAEQWLKLNNRICQEIAYDLAYNIGDKQQPRRNQRPGAAVVIYAETYRGTPVQACWVWTPPEAQGLKESGILAQVMDEMRDELTNQIKAMAVPKGELIKYLTYAYFSPLDLPMQG